MVVFIDLSEFLKFGLSTENFPFIKIRPGEDHFQMYRFLQTPPAQDISAVNYDNKTNLYLQQL